MTQSAISTFIFFNWGLGLIQKLSVSQCLLVFLFVAVVQISFSHVWLQRYKYGPLEWVWRSFTFRELVPIRKVYPRSIKLSSIGVRSLEKYNY